jgi:hypothetical protein
LKAAADGLGVILNFLHEENVRPDDFYVQLERIEYQASRVAFNRNFDVIPEAARSVIQIKGTNLIAAIIKFLNSALLYFSKGFAG